MNFVHYFFNSFLITAFSILLLVVVAAMASFVLARYRFNSTPLYLFFIVGMVIPIRLGVLNIFHIVKIIGLFDTRAALTLIYIAMSLPVSVFILTNFMRDLPHEIEESSIIDGCSGLTILRKMILPLSTPAILSIVVYNFLPIWNDLYFPLIMLRSESKKTVPLGVSLFFGQHQSDWGLIFAALSLASIFPLLLYFVFSKHFVKGITAGAVKG